MKTENIPLRNKFDQVVAGLAALEPVAQELSNDPVHKQSPHIGSVLGRIRGGIEGLGWHAKFLATLPDATAPNPEGELNRS